MLSFMVMSTFKVCLQWPIIGTLDTELLQQRIRENTLRLSIISIIATYNNILVENRTFIYWTKLDYNR